MKRSSQVGNIPHDEKQPGAPDDCRTGRSWQVQHLRIASRFQDQDGCCLEIPAGNNQNANPGQPETGIQVSILYSNYTILEIKCSGNPNAGQAKPRIIINLRDFLLSAGEVSRKFHIVQVKNEDKQ